jgi:hypothetical protein
MNSDTPFKKSTLSSAVIFALSLNGVALSLNTVGTAQASNQACADFGGSSYTTDRGNFTMLDINGFLVGGTNDVAMVWDGTAFTSSSDYTGPGTSVANITASSTQPFFGHAWTAHDIQVFAPGSYSFDATLSDGRPGQAAETGSLNVIVPAGMLGIHMLFDWNGNNNIDVFVVGNPNSVFGAGIARSAKTLGCTATSQGGSATQPNCLWDGPGYVAGDSANKPAGNTAWMLSSADGNGNNVMGIPMPSGGPFQGFNANFNMPGTLTLTSGTVCNPATVVHQFTFTDLTGRAVNTTYQSNTITVAFDSGSGSVPVTVTGGQYSKNGGAYTGADGTAVVGDTFTVQQTTGSNEDGTRSDTTLSIGGISDTFSVTVVDKKPNAFSCPGSVCFTDQINVATSTLVTSNSITIGGMDSGATAPISISAGGEYSLDGGTSWSSTAGTLVTNGDTVMVRQTSAATPATTTIVTLSLGSAGNGTLVTGTFSVRTAGGLNTSGNNFTMLDSSGGVTGGTNDVVMAWDQSYNTSTTDPVTPTTAHMQLSSVTPFFGYKWTAHHIRVFHGPGTYTINVDCTTPQLENGTCTANSDPSKNYVFTLGANQVAAHMLFDWNTATNIDVVDVWDQSATFGPSQLYTGPAGCANTSQVWDFMSSDWDGDAQNGVKMIDGPFTGFSANFNLLTTTPALACGAYTPTVNVADPSNAPGCSISPTPVSALRRGDWWLVAGFLAWLGGIRIRLKRKTQS